MRGTCQESPKPCTHPLGRRQTQCVGFAMQTDAKQSLLTEHGRHHVVLVAGKSIHLQDYIFASHTRHVRDVVLCGPFDGHVRLDADAELFVVRRAYQLHVKGIWESGAVDEGRVAGRDGGSTEGATSVVMQHLMRAPRTHAMPALELRLRDGVEAHGTFLRHFLSFLFGTICQREF